MRNLTRLMYGMDWEFLAFGGSATAFCLRARGLGWDGVDSFLGCIATYGSAKVDRWIASSLIYTFIPPLIICILFSLSTITLRHLVPILWMVNLNDQSIRKLQSYIPPGISQSRSMYKLMHTMQKQS